MTRDSRRARPTQSTATLNNQLLCHDGIERTTSMILNPLPPPTPIYIAISNPARLDHPLSSPLSRLLRPFRPLRPLSASTTATASRTADDGHRESAESERVIVVFVDVVVVVFMIVVFKRLIKGRLRENYTRTFSRIGETRN